MRAARRAFALPLMLIVLLSVALMVTVALQRQDTQTRQIERQINEYRRRHDMYGVRAVVLKWIEDLSRSELAEQADNPEKMHVFELPSGARAVARVFNGQGLPLRGTVVVDNELKPQYFAMLARLRTRPDLTRSVGPWQISMNGAPREVLEALTEENGPSLADEVLRLRRSPGGVDRAEFSRVVSSMQMDPQDRLFITRAAVFDSTLWKISVETQDWAGKRRYDMLLERSPTEAVVHEWIEYAEDELRAIDDARGARETG